MKILLVTDAWEPQINGVVRTLTKTIEECVKAGHIVEVIAPSDGFKTMGLPTYPDIRIAFFPKREVERRLVMFGPDAVHIATEGPLGWAARGLCLKWGMPFTTSYHTKFPEYIRSRFSFVPLALPYKIVREFHNAAGRIMVTTPSMVEFLDGKNFHNLAAWARGVDLDMFKPALRFSTKDEFGPDVYAGMARPVYVNVGRVAVEKNIEAFLKCDVDGSKVIVGDGPQLESLRRKYKQQIDSGKIHFVGAKFDNELARYYADADVFVFPSKTDTFGLVIIEAMATGTPVAAYPAHGPIDIIPGSNAGVIHENLQIACRECLALDRKTVAKYARQYGWAKVAEDFVNLLEPDIAPKRYKRWRRARRAFLVASAPLRIFKVIFRRIGRLIKRLIKLMT